MTATGEVSSNSVRVIIFDKHHHVVVDICTFYHEDHNGRHFIIENSHPLTHSLTHSLTVLFFLCIHTIFHIITE